MSLKTKHLLGAALACAITMTVNAAVEDGLLFYCDFDGRTEASFANGDRRVIADPKLSDPDRRRRRKRHRSDNNGEKCRGSVDA